MKKVTYLLVLLLIVFVFFNVFLLLKIHFSENLSNNNNVQISNPSFNEQVEYSEFIKFNIQNINLYSSIGTYPVSLNEIDFKNKLIVYVNEFNCTPCQDYALKTAIDTFTKDNIIILVEYYNKAWILGFLDRFEECGNVYFFKEKLVMSIKDNNVPLYFCLDENMIGSNLFMPENSNFLLNKLYFKNLKSNFLDNSNDDI